MQKLQTPGVMRKPTDEIRSLFKPEEKIDARGVTRLPYTIACLDEMNRIYPTILTGQTVVVPPEGDMVGNNRIPGRFCSFSNPFHLTMQSFPRANSVVLGRPDCQ